MDSLIKKVKKNGSEDIDFTPALLKMDAVVKNMINRLRICVRVICCVPIDHIIPSEILKNKAEVYRLTCEKSQSRVRELRFGVLPKSRTSLNKSKIETSIQKLTSKCQISKSQSSLKDKRSKEIEQKEKLIKCRSILKDRRSENPEDHPKIDNPLSETPLRKPRLSFQSSEKKLQSKTARCRLFMTKGKKKVKKPAPEVREHKSRWRRKSSTSGRSSETSKCRKKIEDIPKKCKKRLKIKRNQCIRLMFVCSGSNSPAVTTVTSTDKDTIGDGPGKQFEHRTRITKHNIDTNNDIIMDYFKNDIQETL